ncbi:MAG: hypothetical protein AB8H79_15850 [Myxococcota bacterium]
MGMLLLLAGFALAAPLRGPDAAPLDRQVDPGALFQNADPDWADSRFRSDPQALGRVAKNAVCYLKHQRSDPAAGPGLVPGTQAQLERTLRHLVHTARNSPASLSDAAWLASNFDVVRWSADVKGARARDLNPTQGQIRLTRYLVYQVPGSDVQTSTFDAALYAVPNQERALTEAQAAERFPGDLVRAKLTRKQVLDGAFAKGGPFAGQAEPLIWVRRADVHRALMQGTIEVQVDGKARLFNVHRHNGITYQTGIEDSEDQDRFWYFREVAGLNGWSTPEGGIQVEPQVTVAGDVYNLGLGRVVALSYRPAGARPSELRLVVLADTGGAFQPNLFQLDWLAGSFPSHSAFKEAVRHVPSYVSASFLVVKDGVEVGDVECGD